MIYKHVPVRGETIRFTQQPLVAKIYNDGLIRQGKNFNMFSCFDMKHACDRQMKLQWHICAIAYLLSHVKISQLNIISKLK